MHTYQRLNLQGDIQDCIDGVRLLAPDFHFDLAPDGLLVHVEQHPGSPIQVEKKGDRVEIRYSEKVHFFRGLGLLLEKLEAGGEEISITEVPQFVTNGAMFDVSQNNAVPQVATVKNIIKRMAMMGLNMFMLYTEDNYVVDSEPYFGYMRGKYSADELKECDDFAALFGIEMIPCMQTLAHLTTVLQWPAYAAMKDDDTTLLVGNEKVYEFIERLIVAASAPFRSKRIHIGMDEAMNLGLGAYFRQHGLRSKFDLMNEHLARVLQIVAKHGLKPMIWSDMYFRAASKTGGYYDLDAEIPPQVLAAVPEGVQLVYWDYYHNDEGFYREYIRRHREFGSDPIFAGGIWNWTSFAVNWNATIRHTNAALDACKQEGVKEVFATTWGGYGSECHIYATLLGLQLFAEHGYAEALDQEKLKRRFEFCTGACYEDFINIKYLDEIPGTGSGNSSKFLMYQDPLMGLFDKHLEGVPLADHYAQLTQALQAGCDRNGQYNMLFEFVSRVSHVLSLKAEIGLRLTEAYQAGDREALRHLAGTELPELAASARGLRECHRDQWLALYKPFGWDVLDMRYGALLARVDSAIYLVGRYLDGQLPHIEELEEERLYFNGRPGMGVGCYMQGRIVSASQMVVR